MPETLEYPNRRAYLAALAVDGLGSWDHRFDMLWRLIGCEAATQYVAVVAIDVADQELEQERSN